MFPRGRPPGPVRPGADRAAALKELLADLLGHTGPGGTLGDG